MQGNTIGLDIAVGDPVDSGAQVQRRDGLAGFRDQHAGQAFGKVFLPSGVSGVNDLLGVAFA